MLFRKEPLSYSFIICYLIILLHVLFLRGIKLIILRLLPEQLFSNIKTNLGDVNRWSISQYEELINNLSSYRKSASLFWDSKCQNEFLNILKTTQEEFFSFWKPISEENMYLCLNSFKNSFQNEDNNFPKFNLSQFSKYSHKKKDLG